MKQLKIIIEKIEGNVGLALLTWIALAGLARLSEHFLNWVFFEMFLELAGLLIFLNSIVKFFKNRKKK